MAWGDLPVSRFLGALTFSELVPVSRLLPSSVVAQLQSLISITYGHRLRCVGDVFACSSSAHFARYGPAPRPARYWSLLYAPVPSHVLAVAEWLLDAQAMGVFVVPDGLEGQRAADLLSSGAHIFWSVRLQLAHATFSAIFFDAASQEQFTSMCPRAQWDPAQFPLRPVPWFDDFAFRLLPPLPLLPEHLLDAPPRPLPAVLPTNATSRPPIWLKDGLRPSLVRLPAHDPKSPAFDFIRRELELKPMPDAALQAHVLHCLEFGFGDVEPTGSQRFYSQPPNKAALQSSARQLSVVQDNFIKLSSQSPPQAYGPFFNRPPFPTVVGGPQPIVSPIRLHRPGQHFKELLPFIPLSERLTPGFKNTVGLGKERVVQNGSAL
jgi:hypothetical protein